MYSNEFFYNFKNTIFSSVCNDNVHCTIPNYAINGLSVFVLLSTKSSINFITILFCLIAFALLLCKESCDS